MTKKHFIALADAIRQYNKTGIGKDMPFTIHHLDALAYFCRQQNFNFKRQRWLDYIDNKCGPNGGKLKKT